MSNTGFIPRNDAEFHIWQSNLVTIVDANQAGWNIVASDVTGLKTLQANWDASYGKANNKQNRTSADVQAKKDDRDAYDKGLRAFIAQWLANNTKVSDSDRERMGITVKSATRTAAPVPATCPVATVDFSVRLQHTIHFSDEATPRSKAKPEGVHGCEIWCKTGDAADFSYLATDTATPYTASYNDAQAGKTAWYRLRWVNTRGEQGPWGATVSALIVG